MSSHVCHEFLRKFSSCVTPALVLVSRSVDFVKSEGYIHETALRQSETVTTNHDSSNKG